MPFTAKDVQALRQATGAGMMDAKRALEANDGDMDAARQWLREKGLAKSAKREPSGRTPRAPSRCSSTATSAHRRAQVRDRLRGVAPSTSSRLANELAALVAAKGEDAVGERTKELEDLKHHAEGEHRGRRRRALRGRRRQRRSTPTCTSRAAGA